MSRLAVSEVEDSAVRRTAADRAVGFATGCNDSGNESTPLALWHLLSMDAPTVALCWTVFTAWVTGARLPVASEAAMWLGVWTLYAADRLLDTRHLAAGEPGALGMLEARHLFHDRHRLFFRAGIVLSLTGLCVLLPMLPAASLRLYAVEGVFMAGYFGSVHFNGRSRRHQNPGRESRGGGRLPKELLVGPFFAAAVFIPTISRRPDLRWELFPFAVLFAGLCSLNCLSIFAWEHPRCGMAPVGTGWAVRRLEMLLWVFVGLSLTVCLSPVPESMWPMSFRLYALACAGGGVALAVCGQFGDRLSRTTRRAAADACLLTPLLIFPLFHHR